MNTGQKTNLNRDDGFTLVELAIVITIIGLLIAGALVGKDLIRASQVRAVVKEVQAYEVAVTIFKEKYKQLPGDLSLATSYLNAATINGNRDKRIAWADEGAVVWNHLSLAGLIQGTFDIYNGGNNTGVAVSPGVSQPGTQYRYNGSYFIFDSGCNTYQQKVNCITLLGLGSVLGTNNNSTLTPFDLKQIDEKIDDGTYNTGRVYGVNGNGGTCIAAGDYAVTTDSPECQPFFFLDMDL